MVTDTHQDLDTKKVDYFAVKHERRMHEHVIVELLQLLHNTQEIKRLES